MDQDNPNGFVESERGIILNAPLPEERQSPTAPAPKPPKKHESKIVGLILFILAAGLIAFAATQIDYTAISDTIAGNGYEPGEVLNKVISDINLTDDGMRILRATRPALQSADDFNSNCQSKAQNSSTLGCYRDGRIYIYDIYRAELEGIRQATLAHEFLHAVWARMSNAERDSLSASLKSVYDSNKTIQKDMEIYDVSDPNDEIHSRIGTQVAPEELPEDLRAHYAKYFKSHADTVAYYVKYNLVFEDLTMRLTQLQANIAEHRKKLETMKADYKNEYDTFDADLKSYNARRNAPNGFSSDEEFRLAYRKLVDQQKHLQASYNTLVTYIEETNKLINDYNQKAIYSNDLQHSIDSNFKPASNF